MTNHPNRSRRNRITRHQHALIKARDALGRLHSRFIPDLMTLNVEIPDGLERVDFKVVYLHEDLGRLIDALEVARIA